MPIPVFTWFFARQQRSYPSDQYAICVIAYCALTRNAASVDPVKNRQIVFIIYIMIIVTTADGDEGPTLQYCW